MQIGTGNKEQFHLSDNKRVKTGAKGIGQGDFVAGFSSRCKQALSMMQKQKDRE